MNNIFSQSCFFQKILQSSKQPDEQAEYVEVSSRKGKRKREKDTEMADVSSKFGADKRTPDVGSAPAKRKKGEVRFLFFVNETSEIPK